MAVASLLQTRSLLNPVYVGQKAWLYGMSRATLTPSDIFMAVYPKTGSTWTRFVLYHILSGAQETASFDDVNSAMPEFGHSSMRDPWRFAPIPRITKTHQRYHSLLYGKHRAFLTVRDPRDIMVSLLHYARAKRTLDLGDELGQIMRDKSKGLEQFFRHFASWAPRAGLILRYEDLRHDTHATFRRLADFCEIDASDAQLALALERSSMENMRKAQQQSRQAFKNYDKSFVFSRKAQTEQWRDEFGPEDHAYYQTLAKQYGFDLYE